MPEDLSAADKSKIAELATREKYITAMLRALGVEGKNAQQKAKFLLDNASKFSGIDYSKDKYELPAYDSWMVDSIGKDLLEGTGSESLSFTVGSRVLALLKADPKSGIFTNLGDWVDRWTDGAGGAQFRKMVGKK